MIRLILTPEPLFVMGKKGRQGLFALIVTKHMTEPGANVLAWVFFNNMVRISA